MFKRKIQTKDIRSTNPDDGMSLMDILGGQNTDIRIIRDVVKDLAKQVEDLQDNSIKVGDKVMLRKDFTKVYEVESINKKEEELSINMDCMFIGGRWEACPEIKYSLDNNKVYTQDQILPYREDSHLLAKEIKKLKK